MGVASEFGGSPQRNGIQPPITPLGTPGHLPTASEELGLFYMTGQIEDSTRNRDNGEAFTGLIPEEEQLAKRVAEGVMEKGVTL